METARRPLCSILAAVLGLALLLGALAPDRGFCTAPHGCARPGVATPPQLRASAPQQPLADPASAGRGASAALGGSVAAGLAVTLIAAALSRRSAAVGRWSSLVARRAVTEEADLSMSVLMSKYASDIKAIRAGAADILDGQDDEWLLRFAIEHKGDVSAAVKNLQEVIQWRKRAGKNIVESAAKAVEQAMAGGKWDNAPVLSAAPNSAAISKYLTASQIVLVTLPSGDLCSCIRASAIDDKAMMDEVSSDQLIEFFIYAREVNSIVADKRSRASGKLVRLLAANDLTGVSKFPDDRFQKALTESSKQATTLYPGLAGPTVILNLPGIVRLLVSFLTPLFPGAVQSRIKFARGPMAYLKDLSDALKEPTKSQFVDDLQAVLAA